MVKRKFNPCLGLFLTLGIFANQVVPVVADEAEAETVTETVVEEGAQQQQQEAEFTTDAGETEDSEETLEEPLEEIPEESLADLADESVPPVPEQTPAYTEKSVRNEAGGVNIIATYDSTSGLPEDAVFKTDELTGDLAQAYSDWFEQTQGDDISFAKFYDIRFEQNGSEIQPVPGSVHIRFECQNSVQVTEEQDLSIVHFPGDAAVEILDDVQIDQTATTVKSIELDADSFSVYGIVNTQARVREYSFWIPSNIDGMGNPAEVIQHSHTQYVKDGGMIEDPGIPTEVFGDYVFDGWYFQDPNFGNEVLFGTAVTVDKSEEVKIFARYSKVKYATFYDADNVTVLGKLKIENGKVNAQSLSAVSAKSNEIFAGWAKEKNAAEPVKYDNGYCDAADAFYPVFKPGHVLTFDTNGGTYVADKIVWDGRNPEKPYDPYKAGYTFDGWYTDNTFTKKFDFKTPMTTATTVYAKWVPKTDTPYTIIYWLQNGINTESYDYCGSEFRTGTTDTSTDVTEKYLDKDSKNKPTGNITFGHFDNNVDHKVNANAVIQGDGSTIINAYYNRATIKFIFEGGDEYVLTTDLNAEGTHYGKTDNGYQEIYTYEGKWYTSRKWVWGFPSGHYEYSDEYTGDHYIRTITLTGLYGNPLPYYPTGPWQSENKYYPFITHFVDPGGRNRQTVTFKKVAASSSQFVYVYEQSLDGGSIDEDGYFTGSWNQKADRSVPMNIGASNATWSFTETIPGFAVHEYRFKDQDGWTSTNSTESVNLNGRSLHIRYRRNVCLVEYQNFTEIIKVKVPYEGKLTDYNNPIGNPEFKGNETEKSLYEFVGWFADPELTTIVNFGDKTPEEIDALKKKWDIKNSVTYETMPASNLIVYAGWLKKPCKVTLDLNGGSLDNSTGNISYQAKAGDLLNSEYLHGPTRTNCQFIGWKITDRDGKPTGEYWLASRQIQSDLYLKAEWKNNGNYAVQYVNKDGIALESVNDPAVYSDKSNVNLLSAMGVDLKGEQFLGWQLLDKDGNPVEPIMLPGDCFVLDADTYAKKKDDGSQVVRIQIVTVKPGSAILTYHSNYGTDRTLQKKYSLNTNLSGGEKTNIIDLPGEWYRDGWLFIGWNTDPDGKEESFEPGSYNYAVSEELNNLYAQWAKIHSVTISNQVTGNMADHNKAFTFTVVFNKDGQSQPVQLPDGPAVYWNTESKLYSFNLKNNESIAFKVPAGYTMTVKESDYTTEGYDLTDITWKLDADDSPTSWSNDAKLDPAGDGTLTFVNKKQAVIPAGIFNRNAGIYSGLGVAGLLLAGYFFSNKRRRTEH